MTSEGLEKAGVARPASVVWYERLAWAALAVGFASTAADPADLAKYYNKYGTSILIMAACSPAVQLLWIWLIARKKQNWACWVSLIVMVPLGIPGEIQMFDELFPVNAAKAIVSILVFVISTVAVLLLFRSDARGWFTGQPFAPDASTPS